METSATFLGMWDQLMLYIALTCVAAGLLILLYYEYKVLQIKDYKEKYDFVNRNEIQFFWYVVVAFIVAIAIYCNSIATEKIVSDGMRWFFIRLFITASLGVIAYITCSSLVRIYYPRQLERRLARLRNTPRISPEGHIMRKVAESEEHHYLDGNHLRGMHLTDYDVWVDDQTGYTKIEKYPAYQHAEECSECGFYTMRIEAEEIEQVPTDSEQGVLLSHYKCIYCGHREQRKVPVSKVPLATV